MHFNWLDIVFLVIIVLSFLFGMMRGFWREVISLLTWVAAIVVSTFYASTVSTIFLSQYFTSELTANIVSFIGLFLLVWIVGLLVNYIVASFVNVRGLSFSNRLFGALFGFARGILIATLIVFFITIAGFQQASWYQGSIVAANLQGLSNWMQTQVEVMVKKHEEIKAESAD
jgi:membrane protein required for colicin V production